jgi:hypothetical protein
MTGIDRLRNNENFIPNIAHENGIAFASLKPKFGDVYSTNSAPTIFYKEARGKYSCNQHPGPLWNPNDQRGLGFAFGDCTATVDNWASSIGNYPVPFTVVLRDSNKFVIGW